MKLEQILNKTKDITKKASLINQCGLPLLGVWKGVELVMNNADQYGATPVTKYTLATLIVLAGVGIAKDAIKNLYNQYDENSGSWYS